MNVYAAFCLPLYASLPHSLSLSLCLPVCLYVCLSRCLAPVLFQPSHNLYLFTLDFNENILEMRYFPFAPHDLWQNGAEAGAEERQEVCRM